MKILPVVFQAKQNLQRSLKLKESTYYFEKGFYKMLEVLEPETILCYGNLSESLKAECELRRIGIKTYQTKTSKVHNKTDIFQKKFNFFSKRKDDI